MKPKFYSKLNTHIESKHGLVNWLRINIVGIFRDIISENGWVFFLEGKTLTFRSNFVSLWNLSSAAQHYKYCHSSMSRWHERQSEDKCIPSNFMLSSLKLDKKLTLAQIISPPLSWTEGKLIYKSTKSPSSNSRFVIFQRA